MLLRLATNDKLKTVLAKDDDDQLGDTIDL